jgi:hypothetical protein
MHDATSHPAPTGGSSFISPESIVQTLLAFINATHSERDFERKRFWTAMQLPPQQLSDQQYFEEEPGYQAFTQELADARWSYSLSLNEATQESGSPVARLAFEPPYDRAPDLGPICGVDFDTFRSELAKNGFVEGPPERGKSDYDAEGKKPFWFLRDRTSVSILTQQEATRPEAKRQHLCVLMVEARLLPESDEASR